MRILEEFWYGNIEPTEYDTSFCKEYRKLLELICRNEEKLKATMTDEQKDFSILGIREYTWQWPSQMYPSDTLLLAQGLTREEYYSRFLPAILKVDGVDDKLLIRAIREARSARFEFGETPKGR